VARSWRKALLSWCKCRVFNVLGLHEHTGRHTGNHQETCFHASTKQHAVRTKSLDNRPQEHVLVALALVWTWPGEAHVSLDTYLHVCPGADQDRNPTWSLHVVGSKSMLMVLMISQLYLPCTFFFVALIVCVCVCVCVCVFTTISLVVSLLGCYYLIQIPSKISDYPLTINIYRIHCITKIAFTELRWHH